MTCEAQIFSVEYFSLSVGSNCVQLEFWVHYKNIYVNIMLADCYLLWILVKQSFFGRATSFHCIV